MVVLKKKDQPPTFAEFNEILNETSHEDSAGHLFIVDIKFNILFPSIFEKNKSMEP